MIDWAAFAIVALASVPAACVVVTLFAVGVRLRVAGHWAQYLCFALCGAAVLFGIYLIVPALHG
ncbi:hypothetical protein ACFFGH_27840 [Lysobacter korlensis]|uniref:Uncharacterized protein n=1 Tax=Lysobacter korlensis TaxID=553636 RepID=A0ABV6RXF3_9GAMM